GTPESDSKGASVKAEQLISWLPSVGALGAEALPLYCGELNRAASSHILGRFDEAEFILNRLLTGLEQALPDQTDEAKAAQLHLLYAQALAAMGRTYERRGQDKQSRSAFKRAVSEFSVWIERASDPSANDYNDYAISLFNIGSKARTIRAFEDARKKSALNA